MATKTQKVTDTAAGAVLAGLIIFTPTWEGMDTVARRDAVGTGHPITYCYGQTAEFGSVKVGQRFTKKECDPLLKKSMDEIYMPQVAACLHKPVPIKVMISFADGGYNAGTGAMCKSRMMARANAGDLTGACNGFDGWIITGNHQVLPGLIDRRAGELHGDHRKSERALCLEGLKEETDKSKWFYPPSAVPPVQPKPPTLLVKIINWLVAHGVL